MILLLQLRILLMYVLLSAKSYYGGQAVLNGVMMKGKHYYTIAVNTSKGIQTKTVEYVSLTKRYKFLNIHFIRGIVVLVEMMKIGNKSLNYSADIALEDEEELSGEKISKQQKSAFSFMMIIAVLASTALALGLFKVAPLGTATLLNAYISLPTWLFNVVVGLTKLAIFLLYILLVSQYKDIKDLFSYHGAEHKTIHCHESQQPLRTSTIASFSRIHHRCGTAFIFVVIIFTILVTLFIPKEMPFWTSLALRIVLLPLIIGLSYEFQRLNARTSFWLFKMLMAPGLWLQRITTRTPSPQHIGPARVALRTVLVADAKKTM
jgi:uncharacterized protein YqhQ